MPAAAFPVLGTRRTDLLAPVSLIFATGFLLLVAAVPVLVPLAFLPLLPLPARALLVLTVALTLLAEAFPGSAPPAATIARPVRVALVLPAFASLATAALLAGLDRGSQRKRGDRATRGAPQDASPCRSVSQPCHQRIKLLLIHAMTSPLQHAAAVAAIPSLRAVANHTRIMDCSAISLRSYMNHAGIESHN